MKTNKKGISLIVLIITIIVVIILAAAVILSLNNNNPISSAKEATFKSDVRDMQDELSMYISKQYTDNQGDYDLQDLDLLGDDMVEKLPSTKKYKDKVKVVDGKLVWIGSEGKTEDQKTEIEKAQENWFNSVTGNTTTSSGESGTTDDLGEGTNDKTQATSTKPYVPAGFTYKEGTVSTGYVIQDSNGNEFVWVPVSTSVPYEKWCTFGIAYNNSSISDDSLPNGVSNESTDVTTYGGFYIGRYEAGVPDSQTTINGASYTTSNVLGIPTSKKGKASWTYINYTNAKANSESMYVSSTSVKSGLLTGTSWDTTCKWIEQSGKSITDSTSYGNYANSTSPANVSGYGSKQVTGYSDKWSVNNIYDLAGNVWEWTSEADSSSGVSRGGGYSSDGGSYPVSYRTNYNVSGSYDGVGFRVRLYIQ